MTNNLKEYNFTLVISGVHDETIGLEDDLFEAGCDDALLYFKNGATYLEFDREHISLENSILSAIHDIELANIKAKVIRVEPEDLVNSSEIARRTNKSREAVRKMLDSFIEKHEFPPPAVTINDKSILWSWYQVAKCLFDHGKVSKILFETAKTIYEINFLLESRRNPNSSIEKLSHPGVNINVYDVIDINKYRPEKLQTTIIPEKCVESSTATNTYKIHA